MTKPIQFKSFSFKKELSKEGSLVIEGYANKKIVDSWGEMVDPNGCDFTRFDLNPISFFNHDRDYPIGQVIAREIRDDGLFVKIQISNSDDAKITYVRDLIKEGILKTFSIGFMPMESKDNEDKSVTITKWELHEVSVVSLPMNQESTFSVAQGKAFNKTLLTKSFEEMKTLIKTMNEEKNAFQDCVSSKIPELIKEGKPQDEAVAIAMQMCEAETGGKCEITAELMQQWQALAGCKPPVDPEGQKAGEEITVNADPANTTPVIDNPMHDIAKTAISLLGAINANLIMIKDLLSKTEIEPVEPSEPKAPIEPPAPSQESLALDAAKKYMQDIDKKLKELGI